MVKNTHLLLILPRNYQVSKGVVHELEFGDIAVMQILTICNRVLSYFFDPEVQR